MADSVIEPVEDCDKLDDIDMVRLQEQLNVANARADAEARPANAANQRADTEAERADTQAERADAEARRADTQAERADAEARCGNIAIAELQRIRACLRSLRCGLPYYSQAVTLMSCRVQACLSTAV